MVDETGKVISRLSCGNSDLIAGEFHQVNVVKVLVRESDG